MRRLTVRTAGRFTVESSVIEFERLTVERLAERLIVERFAGEKISLFIIFYL